MTNILNNWILKFFLSSPALEWDWCSSGPDHRLGQHRHVSPGGAGEGAAGAGPHPSPPEGAGAARLPAVRGRRAGRHQGAECHRALPGERLAVSSSTSSSSFIKKNTSDPLINLSENICHRYSYWSKSTHTRIFLNLADETRIKIGPGYKQIIVISAPTDQVKANQRKYFPVTVKNMPCMTKFSCTDEVFMLYIYSLGT